MQINVNQCFCNTLTGKTDNHRRKLMQICFAKNTHKIM